MYEQNQSDQNLVMLTLAGDQTAYEVLVTRYQKAVIAAAASVTKNHFMAEDAAQDAFVTAWIKLNMLQDPQKFGSWVCRIAKNCAINMVNRYRGFVSWDDVDNLAFLDDPAQNPAELYALSEQQDEVDRSIEKLPETVKQIIRLHYFEDLSIAEIADRMRMPEGTVKWQLHDGRKRIRKELCAMNEKYTDTLVQRVMKKVEELNLWQVKNDKSGFEKVYREVLREVEDLPECEQKAHALADVLMRGWWWLPGKKNDALFARIREAALQGKNDEVMEFIVTREDSQVSREAKLEFIRDKQIPMLAEAGLTRTLAREWFWLGSYYFRAGQTENGYAAFDKVQELLTPADRYYALVVYSREVEKLMEAGYRDKNNERFLNNADAFELRYVDGNLRYWKFEEFGQGYMNSVDRELPALFMIVSRCDGWFFDPEMAVGDVKTGTDGATLTFAANNQTVQTPAGTFEGCQLWVTKYFASYTGNCVNKTWYKPGVGIVKYERSVDGLSDVRYLKQYKIVGGEGLLPFAAGNEWEYADTYDHSVLVSELKFTVTHADDKSVVIASRDFCERLCYDENSWLDMIQQIRNEYWIHENGKGKLGDVSVPLDRVEALAVTPMEKAHAKAAVSVARRIISGVNRDQGFSGHWNFFAKEPVVRKKGTLVSAHSSRWSFELKSMGDMGETDKPLLYNDIYGILEDATNCMWSDEWQVGASPVVEYTRFSYEVRTQITCTDAGSIITKAGTFENCLKVRLEISGMTEGWSYRGGNKTYYFAPGIGIVRTENEYCEGSRVAVYELTAYEGTGEGFMPIADGMMRRYDALDLTDGFVGATEYTYVADENGDIVIFADRTGIREIPSPITHYGAIQGEVIEDRLWELGKWQEGHAKYGANNFHLIMHMLSRPAHNVYDSPRSVALNGFYMRMLEQLGDGEVPPAWYGRYAWMATVRAAACFGAGMNEEGYHMLDVAFEYCEKSRVHQGGDLLDTGNPHVTGGAKYVFARGMIELPDGTREPIADNDYWMAFNEHNLTYAITTPNGWAWFDLVRNEERFKQYVDRGWAMIKKYNS